MIYFGIGVPEDDYDDATEIYSDKGFAGIWSVAISSHDLESGTYHIAVKCYDVADVAFRITAILIEAPLKVGHRSHGEICPDNFVYHTMPSSESRRVHVLRYSGDIYVLPRGTHPPLKLAPPYAHIDARSDDLWLDFCGVVDDRSQDEFHYLGLLGGHRCAVYDVEVFELDEGSTCEEMVHFGTTDETLGAVEALFEHSIYGRVTEGATVTYYLEVDETHAHDNVVFEVQDLTDVKNPTALLVQIYKGTVGIESELRSERAIDAIYSVAVPSLDMVQGTWFITVTGTGYNVVRYRFTIVPVPTELGSFQKIHGELFATEWIVHERNGPGGNFKAVITKYTGDVYIFLRRREPPTIFAPPYIYMDVDTHDIDIFICEAQRNVTDFIGLFSKDREVVYDIQLIEVFDTCEATPVDDVSEEEEDEENELRPGHRSLGSCSEAGHWKFYTLKMMPEFYDTNYVFEVLASEISNPTALEVYLYENEVPRLIDDSNHFSIRSVDGVYSISVPMIETSEASSPEKFILGIRCMTFVRFTVVLTAVPGLLAPNTDVFATVCQGDHIYFNVGGVHKNARVRITKYMGSLYFMIREDQVPVRLVYPYGYLASEDSESSMDLCGVEDSVWIAVQGGDHCASFFVRLEFFDDPNCDEERNAASLSTTTNASTTTALELREFAYGSCKAGSWAMKTYRFGTCPGTNVVVELEQLLDDRVDEKAVEVYASRRGEAIASSETATENIHSITFNYVDILYFDDEGRRHFDFAVKCGVADTRFRILVHKFHAELREGHRQNGEVCPGAWLFHYYPHGLVAEYDDCNDDFPPLKITKDHSSRTGPHLRFSVRLFRGHLLFVAARAHYPPSFNSRRKHHLAELVDDDIPTADNNVQAFHLDVCDAPENSKIYIGLFGSDLGCAIYDVSATPFSGPCKSTTASW